MIKIPDKGASEVNRQYKVRHILGHRGTPGKLKGKGKAEYLVNYQLSQVDFTNLGRSIFVLDLSDYRRPCRNGSAPFVIENRGKARPRGAFTVIFHIGGESNSPPSSPPCTVVFLWIRRADIVHTWIQYMYTVPTRI